MKINLFRFLFQYYLLYADAADAAGGGGSGEGSAAGTGTAAAGGDGKGGVLTGTVTGAGTTDWRADLPEDMRADPVFATVKAKDTKEALGIVGKMYRESAKLIGVDKIAKPSEKWTPEQWKAYHKEIGVPEKPDGYATPEFKFAEGLGVVPEQLNAWKARFQELGLTPKQATAIMKGYFEDVNGQHLGGVQKRESDRATAIDELKKEFGEKYDANVDVANSVLKKYGSEEFIDYLHQSGMGDNPHLVRLLAKVGADMMEDRAPGSGTGLPVSGPTQALQEINKLKGDKEFLDSMNNKNHPGHKGAVARWLELHKQAVE